MARVLIYLFGTFGGTGYAPLAPATAASLAVAVLWWLMSPVALIWQFVLLVSVTLVGIPVATYLEKIHGKDPKLVVCDEVAGMLVTYLAVDVGLVGCLVGFFWFRVFDIAKPFPARRAERLPAGWGIMVDDLLAGIYANIALRLTLYWTGWL